jgi:hypothetical protein
MAALGVVCCQRLDRAVAEPMIALMYDPGRGGYGICPGDDQPFAPIQFCPFCGRALAVATSSAVDSETKELRRVEELVSGITSIEDMSRRLGQPSDITENARTDYGVCVRQYEYVHNSPLFNILFQQDPHGRFQVILVPKPLESGAEEETNTTHDK